MGSISEFFKMKSCLAIFFFLFVLGSGLRAPHQHDEFLKEHETLTKAMNDIAEALEKTDAKSDDRDSQKPTEESSEVVADDVCHHPKDVNCKMSERLITEDEKNEDGPLLNLNVQVKPVTSMEPSEESPEDSAIETSQPRKDTKFSLETLVSLEPVATAVELGLDLGREVLKAPEGPINNTEELKNETTEPSLVKTLLKPSSEDEPEVTTEQNFLNATHLQQTENNTEEDILEIKTESKLADDRSDESMTIIVVNDTPEEIEIQETSQNKNVEIVVTVEEKEIHQETSKKEEEPQKKNSDIPFLIKFFRNMFG